MAGIWLPVNPKERPGERPRRSAVYGIMKFIATLLLGIALGIYVARYPLHVPPFAGASSDARERSRFDDKLRAWRLTPYDIRRDLAQTGAVVRNQADAVGERLSDARIVAVVKAKLILDSDLSACDVHVSARDGRVALSGDVGTPELVGRAVALALDTEGVAGVDSRLTIAQLRTRPAGT